ncbi:MULTISPECIES: hypothetical protein [unclassified Iodobacter]|uniref:hypothetical protein n=1 Tax=unclassified Iodobacter TaxID=235634 RepID=UPI0025D402C5|nr:MULTISPECIES: hypothetical protein [unclassified Iodobacter]MDW5418597.1 hypothetical protein [Iodobacter sp. CM08]
MNKYISKTGIALALLISSSAWAADAGVSVQFGQAGFYGRLDIGNYPQPQLIYREPRIIQQVTVAQPPLYLVVPPGHAKNWSKHCGRYNACARPVYFVQESWYNNEVVPRYRDEYRGRDDDDHKGHKQHGHGKGNGNGHGRGHDRD